jgi:hypothetical protein
LGAEEQYYAKGGCIHLDDDLTNEERKTQKEVAREEIDKGKSVKIGYRKIQINGEWFIWDEREEKLKKKVEQGEK